MIGSLHKRQMQRFLKGEDETLSTVLLSIVLKLYGAEALNWDGLTIQLQLKDDLEVELPRRIYDQIMGLLSILNTDAVYKDANVFDIAVSSLNRQGLVFDNSSPSVSDVAWAVAEIQLNDPDPVTRDPKSPWGTQIQRYIRSVLDEEGIKIPPSVLDFVPSRTPTQAPGDEATDYADTWGAAQAGADEVDQVVEDRFRQLLAHLQAVGIEVSGDSADQEAVAPDSDV